MELGHIEAVADRHTENLFDFEMRRDALLEREHHLTALVTVLRTSEDAVSSEGLRDALAEATAMQHETALERLKVKTDIADTIAESQHYRQTVEQAYQKRNAGLTRVTLIALSAQGEYGAMLQSMKETLQLDLSRLSAIDTDLMALEGRLTHLLSALE